jgi:hypothetical protein
MPGAFQSLQACLKFKTYKHLAMTMRVVKRTLLGLDFFVFFAFFVVQIQCVSPQRTQRTQRRANKSAVKHAWFSTTLKFSSRQRPSPLVSLPIGLGLR